jgi:hypothetical protein
MATSSINFQFTGVSINPVPAPTENPTVSSIKVLLSNFIGSPLACIRKEL